MLIAKALIWPSVDGCRKRACGGQPILPRVPGPVKQQSERCVMSCPVKSACKSWTWQVQPAILLVSALEALKCALRGPQLGPLTQEPVFDSRLLSHKGMRCFMWQLQELQSDSMPGDVRRNRAAGGKQLIPSTVPGPVKQWSDRCVLPCPVQSASASIVWTYQVQPAIVLVSAH